MSNPVTIDAAEALPFRYACYTGHVLHVFHLLLLLRKFNYIYEYICSISLWSQFVAIVITKISRYDDISFI